MATNIGGTTNCDKYKSTKVAYVAAYVLNFVNQHKWSIYNLFTVSVSTL